MSAVEHGVREARRDRESPLLQGTFETLSLPEVLGLLASSRKTGALGLDAGEVTGIIYLVDGHCRAVEASDRRGPLADSSKLLASLVDVCFTVARGSSGSFRFLADEAPPWSSDEPVELSDALVEVDRLLKQWREIEQVIPSLGCRLLLLDSLEVAELVIDRARWELIVAIDGRRTVRELVRRTGRPELEICHAVLELVDAGAVGVLDPAPPEAVGEAGVAATLVRPAAVAPEVPDPTIADPTIADPTIADPTIADPTIAGPIALVPAEPAAAPVPPAPPPRSEPAPTADIALSPVPSVGGPSAQGSSVTESDQEGDPEEGVPAPDRGVFLRLFSGLREG